MVSSITLGNFFTTADGKNVLAGSGGSGLDTKTLIESLISVRSQANIKPLETSVTANNNKLSALTQLQNKLTSLQSAANTLRGVPGFNTASQNAFDYVTSAVTASDGTAGASYLSVTAAPGAASQSYTIDKVEQLAQATKAATSEFVIADSGQSVVTSGATASRFKAGTFTFKGAAITLDTGDSLDEVASKFNTVSQQTGVTASVLKVSDGHYKLTFSATATGVANAFDLSTTNSLGQLTDASHVLDLVGIAETQEALNAKFTVDTVALERATNDISDVISGLTFSLKQVTPNNTTLNVAVTPDTTTAENAVVNFMNAYNDLKQFAANQSRRNDDGTYASDAYLVNDTAMNTAVRTMQGYLSSLVAGLDDSTYNSLASIGITFTNIDAVTDADGKVTQAATSNVLTYDQTKLRTALSSHFADVKKLFQFSLSSDNSALSVFTGPNSLPANAYTLTINPGSSIYRAVYTDSAGDQQTVNLTAKLNSLGTGYTLTAPDSSALAGLVLLYGSTNSAIIDVTATQGLGDLTHKFASNMVKQSTGTIAIEQKALKDKNDTINNQITSQNRLLEAYRAKLMLQFSQLEQAINKSNNILASLAAQQAAQLSSN